MAESTSLVFKDLLALKSGNIFSDHYVPSLHNAKYAKKS